MDFTYKIITILMIWLSCSLGQDTSETEKTYDSNPINKPSSHSDTSRIVETYDNGIISSISYHKDTEDGLVLIKRETFHYTGPISMVGTFKNGHREGIWTYWYENGKKRLEGLYKQGQKDSLWTFWYENGIISTEYFYDNKTIDGKLMEWHIDKECWDRLGNECECGSHWWSDCETH